MAIRDLKQTHTFVDLEVPRALFEHVEARLKEAGYEHAFEYDEEDHPGKDRPRVVRIDMHGIALIPGQIEPMGELPWNKGKNPLLWTPTPGKVDPLP